MLKRLFFMSALALIAGLLAACAPQAAPAEQATAPTPAETMDMPTEEASSGMDMGDMGEAPVIPAGLAYAEGEEIRFIHTEVSNQDVAGLLSDMMSSPVLYVPSLADAPDSMLATVYVFRNGVEGMGPLGFQPDVFDNPPGADGYSPLRKIVFVDWAEGAEPRELKSLGEVQDAQSKGEVTLEESDIVVNMPFVTWPGGER